MNMPFRINLGRLQDRIRLEDRIAILTQSSSYPQDLSIPGPDRNAGRPYRLKLLGLVLSTGADGGFGWEKEG